MKNLNECLTRLKEKIGSNYKIAQVLGITRQSVTAIMKGGGFKDETALKIAEIIGENKSRILLLMAIERSSGTVKEEWQRILLIVENALEK